MRSIRCNGWRWRWSACWRLRLRGAVGLALGLVAVLFLGRQFEGLGAGLIAGGALRWIDWLLLALVPIAGVLLAMLTARLAVVRALRGML